MAEILKLNYGYPQNKKLSICQLTEVIQQSNSHKSLKQSLHERGTVHRI